MDPVRKARINQKLAFTMFKSRQAFTAFEDNAQIDIFTEFDYKPLLAKKLSTTCWNSSYCGQITTIGEADVLDCRSARGAYGSILRLY